MIRQVAHNAAWNVVGTMLPMLAGLVAVPLLLHGLGEARLGIYTLALGVIGFSGIFDLGLGRALTQTVAQSTGQGVPQATIAMLARKILGFITLLGLFWGCLLWIGADWLVSHVFHLQAALASETAIGLKWMAVSLPLAVLSTGLVGVLEGLQQFKRVNTLRVPLAVAQFLLPALCSQWRADVGLTIGCLAAVRLVGMVVWLTAVSRTFSLFAHNGSPKLSAKPLWRFTSWLTISNVVGPLMVYADRFYLASIFPPANLVYYTVPLDTVFRATALPFAAMNAIFPAFAHHGAHSPQAARMLSGAGLLMVGLWFLPVFIATFFAAPILGWWLGPEFAQKSFLITQCLLIGVLVNGFAHIPYALLQSAGRADITARLHLLELPVYALLIVSMVSAFGILGAAIAWSARVMLDTSLLFGMSMREFPNLKRPLLRISGLFLGAAGLTLSVLIVENSIWKWAIFVLAIITGLLHSYRAWRAWLRVET